MMISTPPPKRNPADSGASPFQRFTEKGSQMYFPMNTALLRHITESGGDEFLMDGIRVEIVRLVCRVEEMHEGGQKIDFTLADEFGSFKAVIYRTGQGLPKAMKDFSHDPTVYVALIGHLRKFQTGAFIVVSRIGNVQNYHEVMAHRAEVVWAWAFRTGKMSPPEARDTLGEIRDEYAHLPPLQGNIMRALKQIQSSEEGFSRADILKAQRSHPSDKELDRELQHLVLYGYLLESDHKGYFYPAA